MKQRRAPNQAAFVLHARPYREQHFILELLTAEQGRLSAVYKGGRPELFRQLRVRLTGQRELKQLSDWSYAEPALLHEGRPLLEAMHLNELCIRLLPRFQADASFFGTYASTLVQLPLGGMGAQAALRFFERRLLELLGFGIDYRRALDSGQWIRGDALYRFDPALGLCEWGQQRQIPGAAMAPMSRNDWLDAEAQYWGQQVHWQRIEHLLEGRPCYTRQWLAQLSQS
ncbi:MAG: recombination protein O N-terminal domain-containing protein [Saccharospirillum sp.]|nr:recombination protein O N-terminal domain-containing protein [Saccharospirillum sp.]